MGTNYYLRDTDKTCPTCGYNSGEQLHIGKSSAGWCFSLHVDPENGINDLPDWKQRWSDLAAEIRDEYGEVISPAKMIGIITERKWARSAPHSSEFLHQNHAEPGPNGLLRHIVDGLHCVGHGEGTWDLIDGEFS